jgi:enoyl-CoA hydratase/carnithine racemase
MLPPREPGPASLSSRRVRPRPWRAVLFGVPILGADAMAMRLIDELSVDAVDALAVAAKMAEAIPGFEEALGARLAACGRMLRRASGCPPAVPSARE